MKLCLVEGPQARRDDYSRVIGWFFVGGSRIAKNSQVGEIVVGLVPYIG